MLLILLIANSLKVDEVKTEGIITTGTVTDVKLADSSEGIIEKIKVRFNDESGKVQFGYIKKDDEQIGDKISIIYDSKKPSKLSKNEDRDKRFVNLMFITYLIMFVIIFIVYFIKYKSSLVANK
jgi:ATP-dependent Zn protease